MTTPDGHRLIFDAGTGIRGLGNRLARESRPADVDLFLTHFHWDHIQGLPFFSPLYDEASRLRIHAPRQGDHDIEPLLRMQMGPVYFPVSYDAVSAGLRFEHLTPEPWRDGDTVVSAYRVRHPADTFGYRIGAGDAALAYVPDNELVGSRYAVDSPDWYGGLVGFLDGVDILLHDAMFTDAEYERVEGWGHSTHSQAVRLAEDAGVARLLFFHHAPERSDDELARILDEVRDDLGRRGSPLEVGIATEGVELRARG